ncbi:golgin candidate 3 isoform X2 [Vigna radiata var. radiata]|uniref:Golgin candidate 3 isoform X2 n=1 Tax=Vigna radiata var. radiata TaxID=3916 RepID=A0A1S3TW90_VIGRR|nr:golgin candidate 3 isoform X2 [Vigna radiata var. radiata]
MWGTIANFKENLNKIALDVHYAHDDDDDDDDNDQHHVVSPAVSDRRNSHTFAHSNSFPSSPPPNGMSDHPYASEIEQYKAEIKRLQASEAEIKALSVNYAAILKEKEDHIVRLNKENGSLKQNLDTSPVSANGGYTVKGNSDLSSNRQHWFTTQMKNLYATNNGTTSSLESDGIQTKTVSKHSNSRVKDKELADMVEGKSSPAAAVQHSADIHKMKLELEQEQNKMAHMQLKLQEEEKLNKSFQEELKLLKLERDKTTYEMSKLHNELNGKISEINRLQMELSRQEDEETSDVDSFKRLIESLEKENTTLKLEKDELEAEVKSIRTSGKISPDASQIQKRIPSFNNHLPDPSKSFPRNEELERSLHKLSEELEETQKGNEELERSLLKLSKELEETQKERDKAVQQLTRLKQHLLEKESEDSEKMDEDSKIIEELRDSNNYLRAQISHLERTLKQGTASQEKLKMENDNEILKSREIIDELNKKLTDCMSTIDAKNTELLNLQTALGQYYAEIEAKEHLEGDLARAKEENSKLSLLLKDAQCRADVFISEKEEILAKLSKSEKLQSEWRSRVSKLEEDNSRLRRAVEQSMTRLNRMSVDSDFLVDRRIVIKLLVTYFQRNHSKEVLDLMVRMLGFSNEDKQRIGVAQQGPGKGVVRGVLGLPGRLVGGILGGGGSTESAANAGADNQSFADLWVDFLLKETEEREKRESAGTRDKSMDDSHDRSYTNSSPPHSNQRFRTGTVPISSSTNQNISSLPRGYFQHSEQLGSEFSTVPLTSSSSDSSKLLPRY